MYLITHSVKLLKQWNWFGPSLHIIKYHFFKHLFSDLCYLNLMCLLNCNHSHLIMDTQLLDWYEETLFYMTENILKFCPSHWIVSFVTTALKWFCWTSSNINPCFLFSRLKCLCETIFELNFFICTILNKVFYKK